MLKLSRIIKRLRQYCPAFENRVAGTATFVAVTKAGEAADLEVPYCFIIPMEEINITPAAYEQGTRQESIRETFATVVCVDNSIQGASPVGSVMKLAALDQIADIKEQILDAFNDWAPSARYDFIRFFKGRHVGMDGKRMWHQFDWMVEYVATPAGGSSQEDEISEIIEGVSDNDGASIDIDEIIVGILPEDQRQEPPDLVIPRYPLDPPIPEPTPETLAEKEADADTIWDVDPLPAWDAEDIEIGKKLTQADVPPAPEPGVATLSYRLDEEYNS